MALFFTKRQDKWKLNSRLDLKINLKYNKILRKMFPFCCSHRIHPNNQSQVNHSQSECSNSGKLTIWGMFIIFLLWLIIMVLCDFSYNFRNIHSNIILSHTFAPFILYPLPTGERAWILTIENSVKNTINGHSSELMRISPMTKIILTLFHAE
jgi:hypothetical protein